MGPPELISRVRDAAGRYGLTCASSPEHAVPRVEGPWPRYALLRPQRARDLRAPSKRQVELSLITTSEGDSDEPMELLEDGTYTPILTVAEEEAAAAAAAAPAAAEATEAA